MILSIILIWAAACALCMAWFGAARRRSSPYHSAARHDSGAGAFWVGVFVLCLIALWAVWVWAGH
jgi:hypothetical protein